MAERILIHLSLEMHISVHKICTKHGQQTSKDICDIHKLW